MTKKATNTKKPNRKQCSDCTKSKAIGEFYNADKIFFPDGKLHMCKICALLIVEENGHEGFLGLLRMLDKPYLQAIYKGNVKEYITMMNSLMQYKHMGFADSDTFVELKSISSVKKVKLKELTEEELKENEEFFGSGHTEEELIWLTTEYQDWDSRQNIDSKSLENLIKQICLTELLIRNKRAKNQDVKNDLKTLQELMGSSSLKPVQDSGAQALEQESFGTLIKRFENEHPIPVPSKEWEDVDGIRKYMKTFFFGHLAKLLGKEKDNPFKKEYEDYIKNYTVSPPDRGEG